MTLILILLENEQLVSFGIQIFNEWFDEDRSVEWSNEEITATDKRNNKPMALGVNAWMDEMNRMMIA